MKNSKVLEYRADLDGLKALAVFAAIFFHAEFEWFQGGFIGVDIFFVISGFLITSIILKDKENNKFSLYINQDYELRALIILSAIFFPVSPYFSNKNLCCPTFPNLSGSPNIS